MSRIHTLLAALLLAGPALAAEEPFSDLAYDAAAAQAKTAGKLLMLDFTATWCPPCKMMGKQTWPDEKVQAWVHEHAVAIQVDIDKLPELAQKFTIQAIPTVVFLKDDQELDRHTGFRGPEDFVTWGGDVLAGKSETRDGARDSQDLLQSSDVEKRLTAARGALQRGEDEVALQHYLWLWPNTRGVPKYGGVRLSFMLKEMATLAERSEPARKAFAGLIDEAQKNVDVPTVPAAQDWLEWSRLCQYFDQRQRLVAWYEARRDAQGRLFEGDPTPMVQGLILGDVFDVLLETRRFGDAVRLYTDVRDRSKHDVAQFGLHTSLLDKMPEGMRDEMRHMSQQLLRDGLSSLYAAALSEGRVDQAAGVAADLLATLDDADSRTALVRRTLDLDAGRPAQLGTWLDEAAAKGADVTELRARLAAPRAAAK